jgi:hypothetical protein
MRAFILVNLARHKKSTNYTSFVLVEKLILIVKKTFNGSPNP